MMRLDDARTLKRFIKSKGYHCIIPLGYGPDRYFARIFGTGGKWIDFTDAAAFRKHHAMRLRQGRTAQRELQRLSTRRRPRSGLEILIDRACGLE